MPALSGTFRESNLTEVLRLIVNNQRTGLLRIEEGDQHGIVAVGKRHHPACPPRPGHRPPRAIPIRRLARGPVRFQGLPDFRHPAARPGRVRSAGVDYRRGFQGGRTRPAQRRDAVAGFRPVLHIGNGSAAALEESPSDRGLLGLADGHRTVRQIAAETKSSPVEVARSLARFRLARHAEAGIAQKAGQSGLIFHGAAKPLRPLINVNGTIQLAQGLRILLSWRNGTTTITPDVGFGR